MVVRKTPNTMRGKTVMFLPKIELDWSIVVTGSSHVVHPRNIRFQLVVRVFPPIFIKVLPFRNEIEPRLHFFVTRYKYERHCSMKIASRSQSVWVSLYRPALKCQKCIRLNQIWPDVIGSQSMILSSLDLTSIDSKVVTGNIVTRFCLPRTSFYDGEFASTIPATCNSCTQNWLNQPKVKWLLTKLRNPFTLFSTSRFCASTLHTLTYRTNFK